MKLMLAGYLKESTARQIVQRTMAIINYSVNVMDSEGVIIASGDASRINQRHEGAIIALAENRTVAIDNATAQTLKGVKPGINMPILFRNRIVGVIGISGSLEDVYAYAELVKMAAELIIEQAAMLEESQWDKRYREEMATQLIQGDYSQNTLASMAAYLGLDLATPRVVFLLEIEKPSPQHLRKLIEYLETYEPDSLISLTNIGEIVVIKPIVIRDNDWDRQHEKKMTRQFYQKVKNFQVKRLIVGGYSNEAEAVHFSYLSAKSLQQNQAELIPSAKKDPIFFYDDNKLPTLLNSFSKNWQTQELSKYWEILCKNDAKNVLRLTLKHYFIHNCDLAQSAKSLNIHVNTLRYRLQRIETVTSLSLNKINELVILYLGMIMANKKS